MKTTKKIFGLFSYVKNNYVYNFLSRVNYYSDITNPITKVKERRYFDDKGRVIGNDNIAPELVKLWNVGSYISLHTLNRLLESRLLQTPSDNCYYDCFIDSFGHEESSMISEFNFSTVRIVEKFREVGNINTFSIGKSKITIRFKLDFFYCNMAMRFHIYDGGRIINHCSGVDFDISDRGIDPTSPTWKRLFDNYDEEAIKPLTDEFMCNIKKTLDQIEILFNCIKTKFVLGNDYDYDDGIYYLNPGGGFADNEFTNNRRKLKMLGKLQDSIKKQLILKYRD